MPSNRDIRITKLEQRLGMKATLQLLIRASTGDAVAIAQSALIAANDRLVFLIVAAATSRTH